MCVRHSFKNTFYLYTACKQITQSIAENIAIELGISTTGTFPGAKWLKVSKNVAY